MKFPPFVLGGCCGGHTSIVNKDIVKIVIYILHKSKCMWITADH